MEAVAAASLILIRDTAAAPELLIVRRGQALAFAGGAFAFPGGRVDPADLALAEQLGGDAEEDSARIAALRELREETGLDLGDAGLTRADLARLLPFARWRPSEALARRRRFDTRFYLARAPEAAVVAADGGEIVQAFWAPARAVIAAAEGGHGRLLFPTRCLLERIARHRSFEEAAADSAAYPPELIEPQICEEDGQRWLTIPTGLGYPFTRLLLEQAQRD